MVHTPPWYNGHKSIELCLDKKKYLFWSKCDSYDHNVNHFGSKTFLKKVVEYALGNMKNFNAKMFSNINIKQIAVINYK